MATPMLDEVEVEVKIGVPTSPVISVEIIGVVVAIRVVVAVEVDVAEVEAEFKVGEMVVGVVSIVAAGPPVVSAVEPHAPSLVFTTPPSIYIHFGAVVCLS